jgi:hypothetical protein
LKQKLYGRRYYGDVQSRDREHVNEAGAGVPIPHLGRDLPLIRDEERARQRRIDPEGLVDRSSGPRPNSRQQGRRSSHTTYAYRRPRRWRACCADHRSSSENQDEGDTLVARAKESQEQQHRCSGDGNPGEPAESRQQPAGENEICRGNEWQSGSGRQPPDPSTSAPPARNQ